MNGATVADPEYEITTPPAIGTALQLRTTPVASIEEMRAAMALKDEQQILASCSGAIISEWIYEFSVGGKPVAGISITGAMEIARIRAEAGFPIRFPVVSADEVQRSGVAGIQCTVTARDVRSGAEGVALAFEPYQVEREMKDREGRRTGRFEFVTNDFADRKALSKAKRNAVLDLIPEQQVLALLKAAKESAGGRVPRRPAVQETRRQVPGRAASENLAPQNPYDGGSAAQSPAAGPSAATPNAAATEAQLLAIGLLVERPEVGAHRAKIEARARDGLTQREAKDCIAFLEQLIDPQSAGPTGEPGVGLGLDDARRKPANAVRQGH